ncbi:hypothetical protein LINGRAPRIM_LOCUS2854 [Linum grandiflorum]
MIQIELLDVDWIASFFLTP